MATFSGLGSYWTGNCTRLFTPVGLRHAPSIDVLQSIPSDAVRVMLLVRLTIIIFALTLLGFAFSLNSAQSQQSEPTANPATIARG